MCIALQMVLLTAKFSKFCSKMEEHIHHHGHHPSQLEPLFEAFKVDVSNMVDHLVLTSNPSFQSLPFRWIQDCFKILPSMHRVFAKLAVDMDYPMNIWEADSSVEEYLSYSFNLLELFNSISSSLSHLGQSRIHLSHALSLFQENSDSFALERLKPIQPQAIIHEFKKEEANKEEDGKDRSISGKELFISKALILMQSVGLWVCGVVLSALSGNTKPYLEMRKGAIGSEISSLINLDSTVHEIILKKGSVFAEEIEEINGSLISLASAIQKGEDSSPRGNELLLKLERFEKVVEEMGKDVDDLFSEIMRSRNELIDCLRIQKQFCK